MIRSVIRPAFAVLVAGCYTLQPAQYTEVAPGTRLAFDLNDAGRVAMGSALGPEVAQVEGRLVSRDSEYVVAVSAVRFLRADEQKWSGESVRIKPAYVRSTYERRLSKTQTAVAGAIGVGLVAAWAVHSLAGGGSGEPLLPPPDTIMTQRIPRRPR